MVDAEAGHRVLEVHDCLCLQVSEEVTLTVYRSVDQLIELARKLIDEGEHSVATILLHTAAEVAAESCFWTALAAAGVEHIRAPLLKVLNNGLKLTSENHRKLYNVLADDEIQDCRRWSDFTKSWDRRNGIVHGGLQATKSEAESSYAAVTEVVRHLREREDSLRST
jgi:hypothetical protein